MFFTYLWRELRRRARQAIFIAVGLALGIGLVITVTAASAGVKNAQSTVLHSLYGVGTDITVTKTPTAGAAGSGGFGFSFRQSTGTNSRPAAGSKINDNTPELLRPAHARLSSSASDVTLHLQAGRTWRRRRAGSRSPTARFPARYRPSTPTAPRYRWVAGGSWQVAAGGGSERRVHRGRHVQLQHQQLQRHRGGHRRRRTRPAVYRHRQLRSYLHYGRQRQGRRARRGELRHVTRSLRSAPPSRLATPAARGPTSRSSGSWWSRPA